MPCRRRCCVVARHARAFESEDAFWCWLKAVARSAARDGGRKHQRYLNLLQNFTERWNHTAHEGSSSEENRATAILGESLEELDGVDRRLVEGKYLHGDTVKELASNLGLTDKAVESRLLRLRRHLRERILNKLHQP